MKKNYFKIIGILITSFLIITIYFYNRFYNYYEIGENDKFEIKVGDKFEIKLYENGSTGSKNCWLNENGFEIIKIVKEDYESSIESKMGYDGSGGINTYTFEAVKKGIDTLKVTNCPTALDNKDCGDYNEKNTKADNFFIIEISE